MGIPFPTSKAFTATATGKMAIKVVLSALLLASANAAPAAPPAYPAEPAYPDLPPVYKYTYAVKDDYSSSNFNAHEERDGYNAAGGYQVALPDGRTQIVTYVSGPDGYVADVKYEGEAKYPEYKPSYAPAPAYKAAPAPVYHPAPTYHAAPVYQPTYSTAAPAAAKAAEEAAPAEEAEAAPAAVEEAAEEAPAAEEAAEE